MFKKLLRFNQLTGFLVAAALMAPVSANAQVGGTSGSAASAAATASTGRSWLWCGVQGTTKNGYITNVHFRDNVTNFRVRSMEFQFLQAVNATYGEHLEGGRGLCRKFSNAVRAQSALADFRNQLERAGQTILVVGAF